MPVTTYNEWQRYYSVEPPVTSHLLDLLFAQLCQVVAAGAGVKIAGARPTVDHFRLLKPQAKKEIAKADLKAFKNDLVKSMGFKDMSNAK